MDITLFGFVNRDNDSVNYVRNENEFQKLFSNPIYTESIYVLCVIDEKYYFIDKNKRLLKNKGYHYALTFVRNRYAYVESDGNEYYINEFGIELPYTGMIIANDEKEKETREKNVIALKNYEKFIVCDIFYYPMYNFIVHKIM